MHSFTTRDKENQMFLSLKLISPTQNNFTGVIFYTTHAFKIDLDLKLCMIRGAASFCDG